MGYNLHMANLVFKKSESVNKIYAELDSLLRAGNSKQIIRYNFIIAGLIWVLFSGGYHLLPPQIPLWFSRPAGQDQLADKFWLWLVPSLTSILLLINISLAVKFWQKLNLLARIILYSQLITSILALIIVIKLLVLLG